MVNVFGFSLYFERFVPKFQGYLILKCYFIRNVNVFLLTESNILFLFTVYFDEKVPSKVCLHVHNMVTEVLVFGWLLNLYLQLKKILSLQKRKEK